MINVVHIANDFGGTGGISSVVMDLCKGLDKSKYEVTILYGFDKNDYYVKECEKAGIKCIKLPQKQKHLVAYYGALRQRLKEKDYDIAHVHGNSSLLAVEGLALKSRGIKIRIAHSHSTLSGHKIIEKILRPVFYHCYNVYFACGKDAGEWLFGKREFHIIRNACNTKKYQFSQKVRDGLRDKHSLSGSKVIGQVGKLSSNKNQAYSLRVLRELLSKDPSYKLLLAGNGDKKVDLLKMAGDMGISGAVDFMGNIDNLEEWYQVFDCLVLPSFYEGFPMTAIEAQLAGINCVISNTVTKDVDITGGVIFLPNSDDQIQKWATAIESICNLSRNNRSNISELALKAGYDIKDAVRDLEDQYKILVKEFSK